jgi:hypothetical protein
VVVVATVVVATGIEHVELALHDGDEYLMLVLVYEKLSADAVTPKRNTAASTGSPATKSFCFILYCFFLHLFPTFSGAVFAPPVVVPPFREDSAFPGIKKARDGYFSVLGFSKCTFFLI